MKFATLAAAICLAVFSIAASATTINVVTTDTADSANTTPYDFGGSLLSVDFTFDLATGTPSSFPAVSNVSGTATWTDGTALSFSPTSAHWFSIFSTPAMYSIDFTGPGTALPGGDTLNGLVLQFGLAEDPFTTTTELSDLLLSGSVQRIGVDITDSSGGTYVGGKISDSVTTYSITEVQSVPAPSTILLLAIGAVSALGLRRRRAV